MNQTKKRLSIINHAISITDIETIQLQVLKLTQLKTEIKIQEIVSAIQAENYAKAQRLINIYIETPTQNIIQRTSQKEQPVIHKETQEIIDEFDLFITSDPHDEPEEININDFLFDELPTVKSKDVDQGDYESLLNTDMHNGLTNNIGLDISDTQEDTFFDASKETLKQSTDTNHVPRDTFFDTIEAEEENEMLVSNDLDSKDTLPKELKPATNTQEETNPLPYKAIPYIAQKLIHMKKQYPSLEKTYEKFDSVENLLRKISQEGYTEKEIEETLTYVKKLAAETKKAEAAQLLLICAATESKFAQFMLARELYQGLLLKKDIPEAFTQMHHLALEDYPEALCDVAQFYEHGIGVSKDQKKAEHFYKEASHFGIKRAEKHCTRLEKQNRSFFKR